jgi:uncharacterized protein (TIGR03437 family)
MNTDKSIQALCLSVFIRVHLWPVQHFFALTAILFLLSSCSRVQPLAAVPAPPVHDADADRHEDNPFEAAEYFREQRVQGDGLLPIERYQAALAHAATMRRYSLREGRYLDAEPHAAATFGTWNSLGPVNVGGRTRGLLIHPQNSSILWAGGATGGLWKSTNGGQSWSPIDDFAPVLAINCLVMAPGDPNTIYACTGEQTQNWRGAGIYKTSDGGNSWKQLPATNTSDFYFVNNIAISPIATNHLYAATNTGLWASLDGGNTWNLSLASPDGGPAATRTGGTTNGCFDTLAPAGQSTDTVFAVCHQLGSLTYSVFRNPDAAGTGSWSVVLTDSNMWYTVLAAAPSQPSTVYALAVTYATTGPYYRALLAFYRSTTGGTAGSWVTQTSQTSGRLNSAILSVDSAYSFGATFCNESAANVDFNGQAGYNLAIAVDPLNPNTVWAAGVGLFRSDDGGANWGYAFTGVHPDQHGLVFDPGFDGVANQTLYNINDGGIYKTTQARGKTGTCSSLTSAVNWNTLDNAYTTTQFYHGVPYPGGSAWFGGTQDNGTLRGTGATAPWTSIYGGDGGVSRLDPLNTNTLYVEYVLGAFAKSTDGGFTFSGATAGITENSNNFPFIAWYVFDPNNSQRLYTGGAQLWRTENGMGAWTAASAPIDLVDGNVDNIRAIAVSPYNANLVLFGSHYGKILGNTATLAATATTAWSYTMPRSGNVAHIEFDPNQPNTVYATYTTFNAATGDNHVYRSTDGGMTWTGIDGTGSTGLPDIPVETILVDPTDSNKLYLGTDVGVFASFDGGNTWVRDDDPFANVIVMNLVLDGSGAARTLYAFTYGRGVWSVPLPPAGSTATTCSYTVSPLQIAADATGGVYPVTVSTGAGCAWSVRSTSALSVASVQASVQAPGSGIGSGQAFLAVAPVSFTGQRTSTFLVQNQTVTVTQPPAVSITAGDEISSASSVPSVPYAGATSNSAFTQNPADPKHSCTGALDYQTGWVRFTAPQTGTVQVTLEGLGVTGQGVVTAYPAVGQGIGSELACSVVALSNSSPPQTMSTVTFPVTGGAAYLLEFSTAAASTADSLYFGISMAKPVPVFAVSPPEAVVAPGGSQQFQPVTANLGNSAVRWQISPQVGVITPAGVYLAPSQITAPTTVTLTALSLGNATLQSSSTVTVQPAAPVTLGSAALTNAASYRTGAVAPGEIVTIFGTALAPAGLVTAQLNAQGRLSSTLNGTQVLFDNIPAPLVYVSANQVSAIVPYEVTGQATTTMVVVNNQQSTPPLTLAVTAVAPALFTSNASGTGQAAAVNQDTTLNGPGSGAPAGSVLSLYGTGEGQTSPGGINGSVASAIYPAPLAAVSVTIGGVNATVQYAGAAPLATAGLLQVNVVVPPTLAPGSYPVVLTIGGQASLAGVTVTVR